jgi:hypothetical protein
VICDALPSFRCALKRLAYEIISVESRAFIKAASLLTWSFLSYTRYHGAWIVLVTAVVHVSVREEDRKSVGANWFEPCTLYGLARASVSLKYGSSGRKPVRARATRRSIKGYG